VSDGIGSFIRRTVDNLTRNYWLMSCMGVLVFGIIFTGMPVLIGICVQLLAQPDAIRLEQIVDLQIISFVVLFALSPGALVLASSYYLFLRSIRSEGPNYYRWAALGGVLLSFLNIPAYFFSFMVPSMWHTMVLFIVAGIMCGLWIAWQAHRFRHPDSPVLPRFSLRSLILAVVVWGALLSAFTS
jgi:hypothetical protein